MMGLLATAAYTLVDFFNSELNPYDAFDRIYLPPENNCSLHEKAKRLCNQLTDTFRLPNGLYLYNKGYADEEPDYGDQALHHGLSTCALAVGFAVGDVEQADVVSAAHAQGLLYANGKLIRGRDPRDPEKIADDASNDSACGQLLGIYFSAKDGGPGAGVEGINNIKILADELVSNDYALLKQNGQPTTYGKLINGWLTDPQRGTLCLAILKAASAMTGSRLYGDHFAKLYREHGHLLPFAAFKFLDYTKTHEMHRSAIALTILADLAYGDSSPEQIDRCTRGLERIWKLCRDWRDPWMAALVNRHWKIPADELREVVLRLHEYPPNGKGAVRETLNSHDMDYWGQRGIKFINVKGHVRSNQPLPYHRLPTQDFWPQRHPYMCDEFAGLSDTLTRHNAVDFLAPYYLLRQQDVIKADE